MVSSPSPSTITVTVPFPTNPQKRLITYILHPTSTTPNLSKPRTRSGALPSRHTHAHHPSPLSGQDSLLETDLIQTYRHPKPHMRPDLISSTVKVYWTALREMSFESDVEWQATTPRVLALVHLHDDGCGDGMIGSDSKGTPPRISSQHEGVLGCDTSYGVLNLIDRLLDEEESDD